MATPSSTLPRLLELRATDFDSAPYDVDLLFSKIAYADRASWPPAEVTAVRAFITAWVDAIATRAEDGEEAFCPFEELAEALDAHPLIVTAPPSP